MEVNVYNVIWADDEIDAYAANKAKMDIMQKANIRLLATAHTSNELREKLNLYESAVDAVITDGNFDRTKTVGVNRSTSGLNDVLNFIEVYNSKRIIPFYLYTGKSQFLLDRFPDGELDYFMNLDRYFEKAEFSEMLDKIKSDVDKINSPQFQIRNKYKLEFEAASLIDDAERNLEKGLLYMYEESWKDLQDYFNPARKIVERIFDKCVENNMLPYVDSLNGMATLLNDNHLGNIQMKVQVMPRPLAYSLRYYLDITQDASHDGSLKLGVDKYVRDSQNTNLYSAILHIAMDLLLWYKQYNDSFESYSQPIWEGSLFEYVGRLCYNPERKFYYTGIYEVPAKKEILNDGDKIAIIKSTDNKHSKGNITKYVYEYKILKDDKRNS